MEAIQFAMQLVFDRNQCISMTLMFIFRYEVQTQLNRKSDSHPTIIISFRFQP